MIELSLIEPNANALAQYLHSAAGDIKFAGTALANGMTPTCCLLTLTAPNVHIADVEFVNASGR